MVRAKPGPQDGGVQPRLEVLDERLTGLAARAPGPVERRPQLGLADVVLRPQPLLLLEPGRVVAVLAALAAVLARRIGPALEVLDALRRERDAERATEPDLGTGCVHGTSGLVRLTLLLADELPEVVHDGRFDPLVRGRPSRSRRPPSAPGRSPPARRPPSTALGSASASCGARPRRRRATCCSSSPPDGAVTDGTADLPAGRRPRPADRHRPDAVPAAPSGAGAGAAVRLGHAGRRSTTSRGWCSTSPTPTPATACSTWASARRCCGWTWPRCSWRRPAGTTDVEPGRLPGRPPGRVSRGGDRADGRRSARR